MEYKIDKKLFNNSLSYTIYLNYIHDIQELFPGKRYNLWVVIFSKVTRDNKTKTIYIYK